MCPLRNFGHLTDRYANAYFYSLHSMLDTVAVANRGVAKGENKMLTVHVH